MSGTPWNVASDGGLTHCGRGDRVRRRTWRLTVKGERWLIGYPLAVGVGVFLGLVAYLAASGGM